MGELIQLDSAREDPHVEGAATCVLCGYNWHAVAPAGTVWFECPVCRTMHGTFVNTVLRDETHWHCKCGGPVFHITPRAVYCVVCGGEQQFSGNT